VIRAPASRIDTRARYRIALMAVGLLATGCNMRGRPNADDRPVPANAVVNFAALYRVNCSGCHGADGSHGPAPPLNDQLFLQIVPDEVLGDVIRRGRMGTPMPAFATDHGGTLSEKQVQVLAAGLKSNWLPIKKNVVTEPPPYLADSTPAADRGGDLPPSGAEVFAQACAGCHGTNGEGGDAGAVNDVSFLTLVSDQALRRLVITGRPDLGMPTFAGDDGRGDDFKPLTTQQVSAIVALLAQWRAVRPSQTHQAGLAGEVSHGAKP
jgi:cytochrome c oxidase cbb3-type subunit 3